ncbi:MAG: uL15 family ribosomal protein [Candidatus Spechtbacterales bacterium]
MQVHDIKKPKQKSRRRVGRGGKRGTYSGRGMKGQKSRAGHRIRPQIRDYIFKVPKLGGPTKKAGNAIGSQSAPVFSVNTGDLEKVVKKGDVVDIEFLIKNKLVKNYKGRPPKRVKLLGKGELKKAVTIKGLILSKSAKEQVEKSGGKIE